MSKNDIQVIQKERDELLDINKKLTDALEKKSEVNPSVVEELTADKRNTLISKIVEKTEYTIDEVKESIKNLKPLEALKMLNDKLSFISKVSIPATAMVRAMDATHSTEADVPKMGVFREGDWKNE